jgi:hypothetical protein
MPLANPMDVGTNIRLLHQREGKPMAQAIAIALSMKRKALAKRPSVVKKSAKRHSGDERDKSDDKKPKH